MKKFILLLAMSLPIFVSAQEYKLMPYPKSILSKAGQFIITEEVQFVLSGDYSPNAHPYFQRAIGRLSARTAVFFNSTAILDSSKVKAVEIHSTKKAEVKFKEDESYTLDITPNKVRITGSEIACYRALETVLQLIKVEGKNYVFPGVEIQDNPRFPWRGLMIDACRHFIPIDVVKRNIDAMATAKMNVFHWHLTEDQAFRIESKELPNLHLKGNNGEYYTQVDVKEVVAYATARGIRVIPEFDIPGHATSWCVAYPEYCSQKRNYKLEENYGIFNPTLDPSNEATYSFLEIFLTEMAGLFPDEYMHIGGDENKGRDWDKNTDIQEFKKKHNLKTNHELQAYFNRKILKILRNNGKKMVGWDEVYEESIPKEIVIQSWRGKESLYEVAKAGYPGVLSNGYYLDLVYSAEQYYLNDPLPAKNSLSAKGRGLIYGGEATMWSELVSRETIDSRIWPVTLAIAERLWSPQNVNNVADMYARLNIVSQQMEEHGLTHLKNQQVLFSRLCNYQSCGKALLFIQLLEPLQGYERHGYIKFKTHYPLSRLADACYTESMKAKELITLIEGYKKGDVDRSILIDLFISYVA